MWSFASVDQQVRKVWAGCVTFRFLFFIFPSSSDTWHILEYGRVKISHGVVTFRFTPDPELCLIHLPHGCFIGKRICQNASPLKWLLYSTMSWSHPYHPVCICKALFHCRLSHPFQWPNACLLSLYTQRSNVENRQSSTILIHSFLYVNSPFLPIGINVCDPLVIPSLAP